MAFGRLGLRLQGLEQSNKLVELCSQYMVRRCSTVLKKYLPPKVQQVSEVAGAGHMLALPCIAGGWTSQSARCLLLRC